MTGREKYHFQLESSYLVQDFLEGHLPWFTNDGILLQFLFDVYNEWMDDFRPDYSEYKLSERKFSNKIRELLPDNFPEWSFPEKKFRVGNHLSQPENMLFIYRMKKWMYDSDSCNMNLKYRLKWDQAYMRGLLRVG